MNAAESVDVYFKRAAQLMDVSDRMVELLTAPLREIKVQIPVEMDDGEVRPFVGWRIQHDNARGPMIGGLRYHPAVDRDALLGLASRATWTCAVVNLPFGGAFGGIACDPAALSPRELERLTRKYVDQVQELVGPTRDIVEPDVNTNPQIMAWFMDQYSHFHGHAPAVVTGKPQELYGSAGRESAGGRGLRTICREILRDVGMDVRGARFVVHGFGNLGSHAARLLAEDGGVIVGVSSAEGAITHPEGIDILALFDHLRGGGALAAFPGAKAISHEELLALDCDVLIPAALEQSIPAAIAPSVRAKIIVEGAAAPVDPEADLDFEQRGIIVVPDILAGAGGVTGSYFEWVQNQQHFAWDEQRVDTELERVMGEAYERVAALARSRAIPLRTAAYAVAIERVGGAVALRGV